MLRRPWLLALVIGLLAAGAAGLVSAHNGDPTQIHACVNQAATPRGQVIIYSAPGLAGPDPASTCGTLGTPVDWGSQGVAGPSGPRGAADPSGVPAPSGPAGASGATGASGPTGGTGGTGPSGPAGTAVYGQVYRTDSVVLPNYAPLTFDQQGPSAGVTVTATGFTIVNSGVYHLHATCGTATTLSPLGLGVPLAITINGVLTPPGGFLSPATSSPGTSIPCGEASPVLALTVGDVVALQTVGSGSRLDPVAPGTASVVLDLFRLA